MSNLLGGPSPVSLNPSPIGPSVDSTGPPAPSDRRSAPGPDRDRTGLASGRSGDENVSFYIPPGPAKTGLPFGSLSQPGLFVKTSSWEIHKRCEGPWPKGWSTGVW